jgi:hypothetical protein
MGRIAENIAFACEAFDAFCGGGLRQINTIGKFSIGQSPVLLKGVQNTPVHYIKILHWCPHSTACDGGFLLFVYK